MWAALTWQLRLTWLSKSPTNLRLMSGLALPLVTVVKGFVSYTVAGTPFTRLVGCIRFRVKIMTKLPRLVILH